MKDAGFDDDVYRFFINEIDTVPQMEALLLLWESRPKQWTADELAQRLYIDVDAVRSAMAPLVQRQLIVADQKPAVEYSYQPRSGDVDRLLESVATAYRRNLVRATTLIHSKASPAVREFARAFKLKKEPE